MSILDITVDAEFKALIPPLADDERQQLEASLKAEGCRDALVVWPTSDGHVLLDGHNRKEICDRLGIGYQVVEREFDDRREARIWIRNNQMGRRNLTSTWRVCLQLDNQKEELAAVGREKMVDRGKTGGRGNKKGLSPGDKPFTDEQPHNTRSEIAKAAGVSTGVVGMVEVVRAKDPNALEKAKAGEISIKKAYTDLKRKEKREQNKARLEEVETRAAKELSGVYDVIVVDPPWPMQKIERDVAPNQVRELDYPTMSIEAISEMAIPCADDCHVWLWTTHKFLPDAFEILKAWGLRYVCAFTWHKPGGFQPFGLPQYNCEFALYARKGSPQFLDVKAFLTCFDAPRGKHSEKPEAFYDVVRRVTGGRRLDMFNRRSIDGFDGWGKEAV